MLRDNRRRSSIRLVWTLVLGFFLGGVLTQVAEEVMWDSVARTFLTTSISASVGPFSMDLVALAFTLGPLTLYLNVLTIVGVVIVAFVVRSWI